MALTHAVSCGNDAELLECKPVAPQCKLQELTMSIDLRADQSIIDTYFANDEILVCGKALMGLFIYANVEGIGVLEDEL